MGKASFLSDFYRQYGTKNGVQKRTVQKRTVSKNVRCRRVYWSPSTLDKGISTKALHHFIKAMVSCHAMSRTVHKAVIAQCAAAFQGDDIVIAEEEARKPFSLTNLCQYHTVRRSGDPEPLRTCPETTSLNFCESSRRSVMATMGIRQ